MRVSISQNDFERCRAFSEEMGRLNQAYEFNNATTARRPPSEVARDNLIGKVAECAVRKLLSAIGLPVSAVDFTIIGENQRDAGDLTVNGKTISVKATEKGKYLLVHEQQLRWDISDLYILCKATNGRSVELLGYAIKKDLINEDRISDWKNKSCDIELILGGVAKLVRESKSLPGKSFKMQATNLYIESGSLRHDWFQIKRFL
jgi:hypothetical protein